MPGAEMFAVWGFLTARSPVAAWCVRMIMNGYEVARSLHRDSVFLPLNVERLPYKGHREIAISLLQLDGGTGINRYFINRQWQRWPTQTENKSSENWMSHKSTKCVWCRPRPTWTMNCISLYRPSTAQYENEQNNVSAFWQKGENLRCLRWARARTLQTQNRQTDL